MLLKINAKGQQTFDKVYFSSTGDTILYSLSSEVNVNSDSVIHLVNIASFISSDTINNLSIFEIKTHKDEPNPYQYLSKDTIIKYGLSYDGPLLSFPDENFEISVKMIDVKQTEVTADLKEKIFLANVSIIIRCKSKIMRNEVVKYMFQGTNERDFKIEDIFKIYIWKKDHKEKYFIWYSIVRNKIVTKDTIGSGYDMNFYIDHY